MGRVLIMGEYSGRTRRAFAARGHEASKATGLWLQNLPQLVPTKNIPSRWVMGKNKILPRWANQTDSGQNKLTPGPDRWKERARTYEGWSDAFANQWSPLL